MTHSKYAREKRADSSITRRLTNAMDLGKKLSDNFTDALSRVKQYTQEVLGTSEKTELDKSFVDLVEKCEKTRARTEKILIILELVLQPVPNSKAEDFFLEKMDTRSQTRFDILSREFTEAGTDLGAEFPYGTALLKTGKAFHHIARVEKEYVRTILLQYVQPLRQFLENDFKAIAKERKILEKKRLDLNACKGNLKKSKTAESQAQAEQELIVAQGEFDRQIEITRLLLNGVNATHANHLRCLQYFVEFHSQYYSQCHQYMAELQRELNGLRLSEDKTQESSEWKEVKGQELSTKMNQVVTEISEWK